MKETPMRSSRLRGRRKDKDGTKRGGKERKEKEKKERRERERERERRERNDATEQLVKKASAKPVRGREPRERRARLLIGGSVTVSVVLMRAVSGGDHTPLRDYRGFWWYGAGKLTESE